MARMAAPRKGAVSELDQMLAEDAARFFHDPTGFTRYAYPWGEPGGPLEIYPGPDDWQVEVMDYIGQQTRTAQTAIRVAISSGHGSGKALENNELVLTPQGWRRMGDLRLGDQVMAVDGTPTSVVGVYPQGERELYRVTLDDGCSVVVDGDHLWQTTTRSERKHGKAAGVRTTREIMNSLTYPNGPVQGLNHCIPTCGAIQHPEAVVPLDPYLLGFWLGDGCRASISGVPEGKMEPLQACGGVLPPRASTSKPYLFSATVKNAKEKLSALGLFEKRSWEKFIPSCYLHASVEQRVALLQGLLDTDGTIGGTGAITFDSASEALADGVAELVRSLGGVARRGGRQGRIDGVDKRWSYRVFVALPMGVVPFRVEHKRRLYAPVWGHKNRDRVSRRFIASVEREGVGQATCIRVAHPSHLFVVKDHIVTHNSALASYLVNWFMTTRPDCAVVATANTKAQLQTKLWRELALWHKRSLFEPWFQWMATSLRAIEAPETWVANAIPWSVNNPEAFAGLHGQYVLVIFDEASAIDDIIWETMEGAMTTDGYTPIWVVQGNPTRSSGGFYRCFHDPKSPWKTFQVDSRTARMTNKAQLQEWIERWGADSNFARVRIYGEFPTVGDLQFIPSPDVDRAMANKAVPLDSDYLVLGVDIARKGLDTSVIIPRSSNRVLKPRVFRITDAMMLAATIAEVIDELHPDTTFVDGNGVGAGVVDRLRQLGYDVIDVLGQSKPLDERYYNKRAECYGGVKNWLRGDVQLPKDEELREELVGLEYDLRKDRILLEDKDDIRERIGRSPDKADALALTFAEPINAVRMRRTDTAMRQVASHRAGRDWRAA